MKYFIVKKGIEKTNLSNNSFWSFYSEIAKNLRDAMESKPKSLSFSVTYSYTQYDCMGPSWSHTKDIVTIERDVVLSQINWEILTKDAIGTATEKVFFGS